jgi:hypothetical protein
MPPNHRIQATAGATTVLTSGDWRVPAAPDAGRWADEAGVCHEV